MERHIIIASLAILSFRPLVAIGVRLTMRRHYRKHPVARRLTITPYPTESREYLTLLLFWGMVAVGTAMWCAGFGY